jgi:hypothetical protein
MDPMWLKIRSAYAMLTGIAMTNETTLNSSFPPLLLEKKYDHILSTLILGIPCMAVFAHV